MTYLRSLAADAVLPDVQRAFPETAGPLAAYTQAVMRGPSPFSVAERELLAAYVSGLNDCGFCQGVHTATAARFGVDAGLLGSLLAELPTEAVREALRPVLAYVRTLTLTPSRLSWADAQAVFAAGWDDRALHDAVMVCGLFNLMNRFVDGLGIRADQQFYAAAADQLSGPSGYAAT